MCFFDNVPTAVLVVYVALSGGIWLAFAVMGLVGLYRSWKRWRIR